MAAGGKEVEKELSDFVTCHWDSLWSGLNSIVANGGGWSRWVRFADSLLIAKVRVFIFMILRRSVGFVLGLLGAMDMLISRSGWRRFSFSTGVGGWRTGGSLSGCKGGRDNC
jgi:hypothetical protein